METDPPPAPPDRLECWYWIYRDASSGEMRVSDRALTQAEAAGLAEAERIEGSRTFRGHGEEDTTPDVFRTGQAPLED
jgi:hypothetical protein